MFYAHFVLAKKGPLSRIWLAAHWDKKLTKAHVFETNIEQSVDGILQPKVKMALRTSGHLLLGVVRIYSRKAKYLLSDCNEAFVKIKMAFRPGMVDLPEENREAAMNAITLPEVFHDFDTAMPDLDDVDIHAQLSMNQTRAEEITMREDYGNINLDTVGDDGFGEQIGSPEMLREPQDLGGDGMSFVGDGQSLLEEERSAALGYTHSMIGSRAGSVVGGPRVPSPSQSLKSSRLSHLDAPIQDDGFGGTVSGTGHDMLAGGLFEDGSLFDDAPPTLPPSERVPESSYDDGDNFGAPSPSHSSLGDDRPATPLDNPPVMDTDSSPLSPAASQHSVTPSLGQAPANNMGGDTVRDTTTLIHNQEESFALAPVDATTVKGLTHRAKRKRKLIVDEVKAISGEEMKAQLSDTNDIITTLDLAPPTKRLMHWKETGGVEKLFVLPGRVLLARNIAADYNLNLVVSTNDLETFDTLIGDSLDSEQLPLENVRDAEKNDLAVPSTPGKKETRTRKRKSDEGDKMSEYQRRQEEMQRKMEESAKEDQLRKERESMESQQMSQTNLFPAESPAPHYTSFGGSTPGYPPGYPDTPGYSGAFPAGGQTPTCATPQFPERSPGYGPQQTADYRAESPGQQEPLLPPPHHGSDFTDAWVSQVAALPPQQAAEDWDDDVRPDSGMSGNYDDRDDDDDDDDDEEGDVAEENGEYLDQETVEQFEDRVLNKRAAKLQLRLRKLLDSSPSITYNDLAKKKDTKKDGAQKFYSLLVLQKFQAVELDQDQQNIYADLHVAKGASFDMDPTAAAKY